MPHFTTERTITFEAARLVLDAAVGHARPSTTQLEQFLLASDERPPASVGQLRRKRPAHHTLD